MATHAAAAANVVKTTIGRLRAKLGEPPLIQTVREGGYRIGEER
jgi:DNA-binding response OmpR family regulator